jgi:hypothetical protein
LNLQSSDELLTTVVANNRLNSVILHETLAESLNDKSDLSYKTSAKVEGAELNIELGKTKH